MSKNYVQPGRVLTLTESDLTHPSHSDSLVDSGDACVVGRMAGVAEADAAATTDLVAVAVEGVYNVPVVGAGNGVSLGETVYIDPTTAAVGSDPTDTPFGVALGTVAAGATTTIPVKLFGGTPGATGYFS
jgi:predicted RecA/RadA family phage recombinase